MDESRKQFEEWVKFHLDDKYSEVPLYKNKGGANYLDSQVDLAWIAWQASREEIELKAPESISTREALDAGYSGDYAAGRDGGMDDWERIIRAAGIKVKE